MVRLVERGSNLINLHAGIDLESGAGNFAANLRHYIQEYVQTTKRRTGVGKNGRAGLLRQHRGAVWEQSRESRRDGISKDGGALRVETKAFLILAALPVADESESVVAAA